MEPVTKAAVASDGRVKTTQQWENEWNLNRNFVQKVVDLTLWYGEKSRCLLTQR
jgi:hypothetical protein